MLLTEVQDAVNSEVDPQAIREQLEIVVSDPVFRSSKRSVQFLRYVVEQTLNEVRSNVPERRSPMAPRLL